jgi:hypothetical protein
LLASTLRITGIVEFPFIASPASPFELANRASPLMDIFMAATTSLSIHFLHSEHHSCLVILSTWAIFFPHRGQSWDVPLVSLTDN